MSFNEEIAQIDDKIRAIEDKFVGSEYALRKIVQDRSKSELNIPKQAETMFGVYIALVVDTIDPWKQNKVRFFSPLLHNLGSKVDQLPFAAPISSMGGFDDCGLTWIPPAGSTIVIIFENGNRNSPFYLGTTWHRDRGPDGAHTWAYNKMEEYQQCHEGHRKGYLLGPNDGSQVFAPWNTENYNGIDLDSSSDYVENPEAQKKMTFPHIYGFKTPGKGGIKIDDGDYKCAHKNKRLELMSGCGNWLILKDDHLHEFVPGYDDGCPPTETLPTECVRTSSNSDLQTGTVFYKREEELRPWVVGPKTPQNNKCELKQTGIQLLSIAGHSFLMDDSVDDPTGIPEWERATEPFDFGCTNKFTGKTAWISATGHRIEMNDKESDTNVRGEENYVRVITARGNKIELNDHSINQDVAGAKRGISMQTTSNHTFEMLDEENEQKAPTRKEGGTPQSKAKKAFIKIRSGYGLEFSMQDDNSQEKTQTQYTQILCPQKDNKDSKGNPKPHIMRFQESVDKGYVLLLVGGDHYCVTYDNHFTAVGSKDNPSDMITVVSKDTFASSENFYLNSANVHVFDAKETIILSAGRDCPRPDGTLGPCIAPVACITSKGLVASDRVFVSASPESSCIDISQLTPYHKCEVPT